jgi:hypothetical protein
MSQYTIREIDLGDMGIEKVIVKTNDDGSVTSIPNDPNNSDYQAYLKYLEENK